MTAFVLNGVAFAKDTVPGYRPGARIIINATVELSTPFQNAVDANGGASYVGTAPITSVEYRLDDGTLLGTVASPGSVSVTVGTLQRNAGAGTSSGERVISAQVLNYRSGSPDYLGSAFCTEFAQVGTLTLPAEDVPAAPTFTPGGLLVRYYNNLSFVGEPVATLVDVPFHEYDGNEPQPGVGGDFSARWTGRVKIPAAGAYRFNLGHDDGARLYINGRLAIDSWVNGSRDDYTGTYEFALNEFVNVWIEHYDSANRAALFFRWQTPSSSTFVAVPGSVLYPTAGNETPPAEVRPGIQSRHFVEEINRY